MAKRMLADVLWRAANRYLMSGWGETRKGVVMHSCNAFKWTARDMGLPDRPDFLRELGAPNGSGYFPNGVDEQGCRYMFLLLAMHVAEDEGIEL